MRRHLPRPSCDITRPLTLRNSPSPAPRQHSLRAKVSDAGGACAIDPAVRASLRAFYDPFDRELEQLLGRPGFADWHGDTSFIE